MFEEPRAYVPSTSDARRRLHVVHVVSSLEIGGQERVVLDLSRALHARGHRVTVVSLAEGGALRPAFGEIPVVTIARRPGKGIDPLLPIRMASALRSLAPDVVHTHNPAALTYAGPAARALSGVRLVHTKHGANPAPRLRTRAAQQLLARLCHAYVAVSEPTADVARKVERIEAPLLHVIPNGIDVAAYRRDQAARRRVRGELGVRDDCCVVGTVGRLAPEKNQALLVDAVAGMLGPELVLAVVGEGPERGRLEARVRAEDRPFVHLLGARHDVPAVLSAFDIFVLSSSTEGLPLVVPEAMASGLPVIATRVGGLPGVVRDGVFGTLVPPGDPGALRRAIAELISDPGRRRRYTEAARREAAARFSLDRVIDAYEALYDPTGLVPGEAGRPSRSADVPLPPECASALRT